MGVVGAMIVLGSRRAVAGTEAVINGELARLVGCGLRALMLNATTRMSTRRVPLDRFCPRLGLLRDISPPPFIEWGGMRRGHDEGRQQCQHRAAHVGLGPG